MRKCIQCFCLVNQLAERKETQGGTCVFCKIPVKLTFQSGYLMLDPTGPDFGVYVMKSFDEMLKSTEYNKVPVRHHCLSPELQLCSRCFATLHTEDMFWVSLQPYLTEGVTMYAFRSIFHVAEHKQKQGKRHQSYFYQQS